MSDQPRAISGSASGTYQYDGHLKRVKSVVGGQTIYNVYDLSGTLVHVDQANYQPYDHQSALRMSYKVADGEQVERVSLQTGHPLAKWTGAFTNFTSCPVPPDR